MSHSLASFLRWFVTWNGHKTVFAGTLAFFAAYMFMGSWLGFDHYPFQFLTMLVSLWAISLNQATLFMQVETDTTRVADENNRILREILDEIRSQANAGATN